MAEGRLPANGLPEGQNRARTRPVHADTRVRTRPAAGPYGARALLHGCFQRFRLPTLRGPPWHTCPFSALSAPGPHSPQPTLRPFPPLRATNRHLRSPPHARSSGVHWRRSLPSGARESGERARTPLLSRGAGRRAASHLRPPGPVPITSGCTGLATLRWGRGGGRKSQGWEPAGGCALLPHPRHPRKGKNEKANTPEAGAATYDATRNEQGLFFVGAQLLPRRRRQRLSLLSGQ